MASFEKFEDIEAWQLARELCKDVIRIIKSTELNSDYKLKDQINGSSGSIMDNISEGFERGGNKEFIYFLSIAKASSGECRSQLYRIFDRNYISEDEFNQLKIKTEKISGKIQNLINYLKKSEFRGVKFK